MDPGTAVGAVSLLFQVFAGCIKAYQLISEARGFEKDYQFICIRFKTEQYRLLDFASVAQLTEKNETLIFNASSRTILHEVLDQQRKMMEEFGRFDDRLQPLAQPLILQEPVETSLSKGISNNHNREPIASRFPHANVLLQKALTIMGHGKIRLHWAVFDRTKVEELLSRLVASNNFLQELLTTRQVQMLMHREIQTGYQIMQLNNRVDQVYEIVQAGLLQIGPPSTSAVDSGNGSRTMAQLGGLDIANTAKPTESVLVSKLVELGKFKAFATATAAVDGPENGLAKDFRASVHLPPSEFTADMPLQLQQSDITLDENEVEQGDAEDINERRIPGWWHRSQGQGQGDQKPPSRTRIWVEWKRMDPRHVYNIDDGPDPNTLRRFRALVRLLREHDQTRHFRAPPCIGYYHDVHEASRASIRYGLVFKSPPDMAGIDPDTPPQSLRELLEDKSFPSPSLTMRVSLMRTIAQAVEKLHSVNWLHKGLRSENIIFFHCQSPSDSSTTADGPDIDEPYLTGFDYSRAEDAVSMSSNAPKAISEDLYRHPGVQGGPPREGSRRLGYKKRHDIYSLGVVLSEIAHWKAVEDVLGVEDRSKVKVKDVIGVRSKLLSKENMDHVRFLVGVAVAEAISACLVGPTAFDLLESDSEEDVEVAAKLQAMFYQVVVNPLLETKI